ncbi:hypothetical protein, partial [Burkholderia pseudomallei]|uniref:hypothetical protein n=1 Tax=Burkholderia pseudomallei TaxID=28450 RepID=UPI001E28A12E
PADSLSSNLVPEVPCDRAIPPPDIHKIRRQVTQSFSKAPRFSAMNLFYGHRRARTAPAATMKKSRHRQSR